MQVMTNQPKQTDHKKHKDDFVAEYRGKHQKLTLFTNNYQEIKYNIEHELMMSKTLERLYQIAQICPAMSPKPMN